MLSHREEPETGIGPAFETIASLDRLFSRSPLGVCFLDHNKVIRWANATFASQIGVSLDWLIDKPGEEAMLGWNWQSGEIYDQVRRTGEGWHDTHQVYIFPDQPDRGKTYWNISVTPLHGTNNTFRGWLLEQSEVTGQVRARRRFEHLAEINRKQAESLRQQKQALKQSEKNLAAELKVARCLQQLSTQLITGDDDGILYDHILDTVVETLHSQFASIQMFHPERGPDGELRLLGHRGFSKKAAKFWEWVSVTSNSACGIALSTRQRVAIPDVLECDFLVLHGTEDLEMCLQTGIRAVQTTPLISRSSRLLGMFSTHWSEPHELTAIESRTLDILARQVADLIERKQAEEKLREAEQKYRELVQYAPAGIYEVAFQSQRFTSVNDVMCQMLDYSREELLAMNPFDLMDETSQARFQSRITKWLNGEEPDRNVEYKVRAKDGHLIDVFLNTTFISDEDGQPLRATVIAHDITERKRAEEEREKLLSDLQAANGQLKFAMLQRQRRAAELEAVFEGSADPMVIIQQDGSSFHANQAMIAMYGFEAEGMSREEIMRKVSVSYADGRAVPIEDLPSSRALRGETISGEHLIVTNPADKTYHVLASASPIMLDSGADGAVAAWHDITELERALELVEEAVKERDMFLSVASHELKTPLTSLIGYTQVMINQIDREGNVDAERLKKILPIISQQSGKLARLINQLLDVSRIQTGRLVLDKQPMDLVTLVRELAASMLSGPREHGIGISAPEKLEVTADALRLEQVLRNLFDNAKKFSPEGGLIEVVVSEPDSRSVEIAVRDHGVGVKAEDRDNIFDRFYQAHQHAGLGGMGLGLFISREIVELHGGSIRAEFPEDGGTRFVVTLPAEAGEA